MKTSKRFAVGLLMLVLAVGCEPSSNQKQSACSVDTDCGAGWRCLAAKGGGKVCVAEQAGQDVQGEAAGAETLEEASDESGTGTEAGAETVEAPPEIQAESVGEAMAEVGEIVITNPEVVAVIANDEGQEVIPQTVLHLHGSGSTSPFGAIVKYQWSVEQPSMSTSMFVPSADYPDPTFEANVAGEYTFRLQVTDSAGNTSAPAELVVYVLPCCNGIHVELLWVTPNDDNPFDEGPFAGSDLDLHFAHPLADGGQDLDGDDVNDPWFDPGYDCFWFYSSQDWGDLAKKEDDPSLDRDDVDGAGPENLNLDQPGDGLTYHLGVNYWDDHGFGTSYATVRVYVGAVLAFETQQQALVSHDMWWVADLAWPSGTITPKLTAQGQPWVTHEYHHPYFQQ
jgi:hypothetical protein